MSFNPFSSVPVATVSVSETFPLGRHEAVVIGVRHSFRSSGAPQMSIHFRLPSGLCRWYNLNYARPTTTAMVSSFLGVFGPALGQPSTPVTLAQCGWDPNTGTSAGVADAAACTAYDAAMTAWLGTAIGTFVNLNVVAARNGGDPVVYLNRSKRPALGGEVAPTAAPTLGANDDDIPF